MLKNILKNNPGICLSVIACIIIGICMGAFTVNNLNAVQVEELSNYLSGFTEIYKNQSVAAGNLFLISLGKNFKYLLLIFIAGMTIIGLPVIYILCAARSFISGFTMGVFIGAFGSKGMLICVLTLLPTDLLRLSAFMFLSINAVIFSVRIFKLLARKGFDISFKNSLLIFLRATFISAVLLFAGVLFETLLTPVLLRLIL